MEATQLQKFKKNGYYSITFLTSEAWPRWTSPHLTPNLLRSNDRRLFNRLQGSKKHSETRQKCYLKMSL